MTAFKMALHIKRTHNWRFANTPKNFFFLILFINNIFFILLFVKNPPITWNFFLSLLPIRMGYFYSLNGTITDEFKIVTNLKLSKQTLKIDDTATDKKQREIKLSQKRKSPTSEKKSPFLCVVCRRKYSVTRI